jgi:aerobic-type carbon monoxide dehydrogenase small subunit (CoxS/CutS family)
MARVQFQVNGRSRAVEVAPEMPLLWVLREELGLTGTKFGCGEGQCGACTVLLDGKAVRSCQVPISTCEGRRVSTVEGLSADLSHPVQRAWLDEDVAQCGYCQTGMLMSVAALLQEKPQPTESDIDEALADHICRCGTYQRVRKAIGRAAAGVGGGK